MPVERGLGCVFVWSLGLASLAGLLACAGAPPPLRSVPEPLDPPLAGEEPAPMGGEMASPAPPAPVPEVPSCEDMVEGAVRRAALIRAAASGVGVLLRNGISVEARKDEGRFRGWAVRSLFPGDPCWARVDLRAGDIVLRINGKRIERPEQAHDVLQSLRTAPAIVVEYERAGAPLTLRVPIVDR